MEESRLFMKLQHPAGCFRKLFAQLSSVPEEMAAADHRSELLCAMFSVCRSPSFPQPPGIAHCAAAIDRVSNEGQ